MATEPTKKDGPLLTTADGAPIADQENSLTAGPRGPLLMQDVVLQEQMQRFNRERVPERVVHAKGSGAYGTFTVTNDITQYTKAAMFSEVGKETELSIRFSTVAGERGAADAERDPRGFAVKFYTEDGNFDMVGNNTPIFFIRDPLKFQHFIRSQKRRADNALRDHDMMWDFWTLSPESAHQVTYLMGDRGVPRSWREMNGYSSHTYMLINEDGEKFWVKFHFHTNVGDESGNAHLTQDEAVKKAGEDSDYHRRDLFDAIAEGNFPSWTLKWQIMPFEDAKTYRINPFDLTKTWPHADYPLIEVGTLTLNENPVDWDTQIEQLAFEPNNMVPGIGLSPDKMLLARGFSYSDAHRARLGVNYKQIPVNAPKNADVHSYSRAGHMRTQNAVDPVYAPNSYGGPAAQPQVGGEATWHADGDMVRQAYTLREDDDDWSQAGALVREVMDDEQRDRFVSNVSGHLADGVSEKVLVRAFEYWKNVDEKIGERIEEKVREMIGGKSTAPGMASAKSISGKAAE